MISVFVPSHITGFFSILDNEDPLLKGSLGAGVLLDKGVITEMDENDEFSILINGKKDEYNEVIILKTIELMEKDIEFDMDNVLIKQTIQVPSIEECGKYAHLAEVELGTGLGDVIGELSKGIVLRTKPGAPGYGEAKSIVPHEKTGFGVFEVLKSDFYVITKSLGEISTASIIEDPKHKKVITQVGLEIGEEFNKKDDGIVIGSKFKNKFNVAVDSEFNEEETIKKFMNASLKFAKKTHLINDELLQIVHELHGKVLGSSMAMLGNTVFAIANEDQKLKLEAKYYNEFEFYKMDTEGICIMSHD